MTQLGEWITNPPASQWSSLTSVRLRFRKIYTSPASGSRSRELRTKPLNPSNPLRMSTDSPYRKNRCQAPNANTLPLDQLVDRCKILDSPNDHSIGENHFQASRVYRGCYFGKACSLRLGLCDHFTVPIGEGGELNIIVAGKIHAG